MKDEYEKETNRDIYDNSERGSFCDDYVNWLENKLQLLQSSILGQSLKFKCYNDKFQGSPHRCNMQCDTCKPHNI